MAKKTRTVMRKNKSQEDQLPVLPDPAMSTTQVMLVAFFFRQFVYHGSAALLVHREEMDPLEPSLEYGEEVLRAFNDKPPDFEMMLTKVLAGQKNSLHYKRTHAPSEYTLARRKVGKELKEKTKKCTKDANPSHQRCLICPQTVMFRGQLVTMISEMVLPGQVRIQ